MESHQASPGEELAPPQAGRPRTSDISLQLLSHFSIFPSPEDEDALHFCCVFPCVTSRNKNQPFQLATQLLTDLSTTKQSRLYEKMPPKKSSGNNMSKNQQKKIAQVYRTIYMQNKLFNNYFKAQYGAERWASLSAALQKPYTHVALMNPFADRRFVEELLSVPEGKVELFFPELFGDKVYVRKASDAVGDAKGEERLDDNGALVSNSKKVDEEDIDEEDKHAPSLFPPPSQHRAPPHDLYPYYPLDGASLLPPLFLLPNSRPHTQPLHIWDVCAAPGGKSLYMALDLFGGKAAATGSSAGSLLSSDVSRERKKRLERTLMSYVPPAYSPHMHVACIDGTQRASIAGVLGEGAQFDCILIDAPCASERHLLTGNPYIALGEEEEAEAAVRLHKGDIDRMADSEYLSWASGRSKANAERQLKLLLNAFPHLKYAADVSAGEAGGRLVYSTCSINRVENDDVIEKFLKKTCSSRRKTGVEYEARVKDVPSLPIGEKT
eukprot:gene34198-41396_t